MDRYIQITYPLTDQLLMDVICTALEGGIGYWCSATDITRTEDKMNYTSFRAYDDEDDGFLGAVDIYVIATGIRQILNNPNVVCSKATKRALERAVSENDSGYIDAEVADCIVQMGLFGGIVYG